MQSFLENNRHKKTLAFLVGLLITHLPSQQQTAFLIFFIENADPMKLLHNSAPAPSNNWFPLCILDLFFDVVQLLLQGEHHSDRQRYCECKKPRTSAFLREWGSRALDLVNVKWKHSYYGCNFTECIY